MQAAESIKVAAANPGGIAGAGVGLGAGVAIGGMMGQAMQGAAAPPPAPGASSAPPPPPVPASPRWSLTIDGKTYGPYPESALKAMLAAGQVLPTTLAWRPGAAGWAPVQSYPELGGTGGDVPPPPPPPAR